MQSKFCQCSSLTSLHTHSCARAHKICTSLREDPDVHMYLRTHARMHPRKHAHKETIMIKRESSKQRTHKMMNTKELLLTCQHAQMHAHARTHYFPLHRCDSPSRCICLCPCPSFSPFLLSSHSPLHSSYSTLLHLCPYICTCTHRARRRTIGPTHHSSFNYLWDGVGNVPAAPVVFSSTRKAVEQLRGVLPMVLCIPTEGSVLWERAMTGVCVCGCVMLWTYVRAHEGLCVSVRCYVERD